MCRRMSGRTQEQNRSKGGIWWLMVLVLGVAGLDVLAETTNHWSLKLVAGGRAAEVQDPWISNPIDAFILERLRKEGLTPSARSDAETFIRRLFLVMHGLPPSPEEVARWRERAFSTELIEYVLASPRYGERWAQHWLDVIRWAETVGFETNLPRPNAWRYRDWVIDALNADKPYDRFVFEQIAGDTIGEDAAVGFLVAGPANLPGQIGRDEESMRQARQDELDEVLRTVGQGVMGLTVGCARCHDHKFDPISIRDYYSMQAIFAGLRYGDRRFRGPENDRWTAQAREKAREVESLKREVEAMRQKFQLLPPVADVQEERFPAVLARAVRMEIGGTASGGAASLYEFEIWKAGTETNVGLARMGGRATASGFALENQTRHPDNLNDGNVDPRQAFPWKADKGGPAWVQVDLARAELIDRVVWHRGETLPVEYEVSVLTPEGVWRPIVKSADRWPRTEDKRAAAKVRLTGLNATQVAEVMRLTAAVNAAEGEHARLAAGPQTYGAVFSDPETTWLLNRGDPMRRIEELAPGVPAVLGCLGLPVDAPETERRIALARHLTDARHPLTARVMANRVWQQHFGEGLVETPSDFGKMGSKPTHPELLDWLARRFVEGGWSLKNLHRLILSSSTFRQSSAPRESHLRVDGDARLLWRYPTRRMEAEAIRDSVLAVSGKLNLKMHGPGFDFFNQKGGLTDYKPVQDFKEDGWRRMIYSTKIRMQPADIFGAFDCPDAGQMSPKRARSITPIQALAMMNSAFMEQQSRFFAERIRQRAGMDSKAQARAAVELAFARSARELEVDNLARLAGEQNLEEICRAIFNSNEFVFIP